jgi:AraC family transcriptional regulator
LPHFAKSDPLIYQLGRSLKIALETDPIGSRIYAESLSNALAAHLIYHYSTTARSLETIRCVSHPQTQQAIDYIHAHLTSQAQFTNFFRKHTGINPTQYRKKL